LLFVSLLSSGIEQVEVKNFGVRSWIRKNSAERALGVDQSELWRVPLRVPLNRLDGPQSHPKSLTTDNCQKSLDPRASV